MRSWAIGFWGLLVVLAAPVHARAEGFWFGLGSARWAHDGGFGGDLGGVSDHQTPFALSPPRWWHSDIVGVGDDVSSADAGVGHYYDDTTVVATFAFGTGVSQSAPSGEPHDAATLTVHFQADAEARDQIGFTDNTIFYNFPLGGEVTQDGFVSFLLDATVTGIVGTESGYREVFSEPLTAAFSSNTPGPVQAVLSESRPVPDLVPLPHEFYAGILVEGILRMEVKNDGGPAAIVLPLGLALKMEGTPVRVPEPSTFVLLSMGALALLTYAWRRRRGR